MKRERIGNGIGLALLLACFGFSLVGIMTREREESQEGAVTLRFAHWQLEGKLRDAFDTLAREYEALHPGVRVKQIAIPERVYPQWMRTQLVGEMAPDILQLGMMGNNEDEMLARFFTPLTAVVDEPNPYNEGTSIEGMPWRETFVDGLSGGYNYRPNLLDYYGVALSLHTVRVYYNVDLWKELFGDAPVPANYGEFIARCDDVSAYAKRRGVSLIPIASSKNNGPMLIDRIASSQTQRLVRKIVRQNALKNGAIDIGLGYLRGDWDLDTPEIGDLFAIEREVAMRMQPGYMQVSREDAAFHFLQGRAMFITTGSWDAPSFRLQATFNIDVFNVPVPGRDAPRFGRNVLGPASELGVNTGLTFGVTRLSTQREAALDFLRYLTSSRVNARFSELSDWMPAVADVAVPRSLQSFAPLSDGYINGFSLRALGGETKRTIDKNYHLLSGPYGSIEAFKEAILPEFKTAVSKDMAHQARIILENVVRQDITLAANRQVMGQPTEGAYSVADIALRIGKATEAQNEQEATHAWLTEILSQVQR